MKLKLVMALGVGFGLCAVANGDAVTKSGEVVSKRQLADVQDRLIAWCSSIGGFLSREQNWMGHVSCYKPLTRPSLDSSLIPPSGMLILIDLVPAGGGIRVKWTSDSTVMSRAIKDVVK